MRTRDRIINRRPERGWVKDPTHHYQFWSAEERQIDARNLLHREVPYGRAVKLFATRWLG